MDNTEFVERLKTVSTGLGRLSDDLYNARKSSVSRVDRADVIQRAKAKLLEYEKFLPSLTPGRRETTINTCDDDISDIRERLTFLEEME
jgi:hypothetical protein